ncbi:oxidoreductase, partial [Pseudomonas guariconensis]|nr:oxidoreductase [Pseudomonas guariconensis]
SGVSLVSAGAIVSVVSGFFDAAQAGRASKRTLLSGDIKAFWGYSVAGLLHLSQTAFAIRAIFNPLLLGPLGAAIILGALAYGAARLANKKETSPLERWARRCYFGKANETPVIHWDTPYHADTALAELNTATLGLEAVVGFVTHKADYSFTGKIGGLVNLTTYQKIKFTITMPDFDEHRSGYRWSLMVHRQGDGNAFDYGRGEKVTTDEFYMPIDAKPDPIDSKLKSSYPPKFIDYKLETMLIKNAGSTTNRKGVRKYKQLIGSIDLTPESGRPSIIAATLTLTFWPDRNMPSAYAESTVLGLNE